MTGTRKHYIDYLRVLAIFAVIIIHVTGYFYVREEIISNPAWWTANVLGAFSKFAVPLFVMISGALLLGKKVDTLSFYKKRAHRLFPPIIFWVLLYVIVAAWHLENPIVVPIGHLLAGNFTFHLWYLSMFVLLMAFTPFIGNFLNGNSPKKTDLSIFLIILFFLFSLNIISNFLFELKEIELTWFKTFPWFFAYFIGGHYFDKYGDEIKIKNSELILSIIVLCLGAATLNYLVREFFEVTKDDLILNYFGPFTFIITFLVFILFRKNHTIFKSSKLIASISEASFGMYLLHPMFLVIGSKEIPHYFSYPIPSMILSIIGVISLSYLVISLLRKTSFGKTIC